MSFLPDEDASSKSVILHTTPTVTPVNHSHPHVSKHRVHFAVTHGTFSEGRVSPSVNRLTFLRTTTGGTLSEESSIMQGIDSRRGHLIQAGNQYTSATHRPDVQSPPHPLRAAALAETVDSRYSWRPESLFLSGWTGSSPVPRNAFALQRTGRVPGRTLHLHEAARPTAGHTRQFQCPWSRVTPCNSVSDNSSPSNSSRIRSMRDLIVLRSSSQS